MNAIEEKAALDGLVRHLLSTLEARGRPAAEVAIEATELKIYPTTPDAFAGLTVLEYLGLVRQVFGVVFPGRNFQMAKDVQMSNRRFLS